MYTVFPCQIQSVTNSTERFRGVAMTNCFSVIFDNGQISKLTRGSNSPPPPPKKKKKKKNKKNKNI